MGPGLHALQALVIVALTLGATVAILIFLLGKYSGATIKTALTAAVETAGLLRRRLFLPFIPCQTLGGLLAGFTLHFLVLGPVDPGTELESTKLAVGLSPIMGVLLEANGYIRLSLFSGLIAQHRSRHAETRPS